MRKLLSTLLIALAVIAVNAQNIQLHYDFGGSIYDKDMSGRPAVTSTIEMFKPDKWGNTYFFVDMDINGQGMASAYWEISRELKFWEAPFLLHVEYNGGLAKGFSYNNAYLGGLTYSYMSKDFRKNITLSALYKYIHKHLSPHNFQLTSTWFIHFAHNGLCTFSGFADFWREKNQYGSFIFLSEPQFWVNLNKLKAVDDKFKLSIGTELELSHDFGGRNGFYAVPTLAVKWSFD